MFWRRSILKIKNSCPVHVLQCTQTSTLSTKPVIANLSASQTSHFLKKKFDDFVTWYEQLTGMDEVRMMQNRVIEAQDRFVAAQEKRRTMTNELNKIQSKLKEIYSELDTTNRGEERYLQLITQEHAILKEERRLTTEFSLVEREERDSFTNLSSCVKESHEKERVQAERTKYWSIIGSIIGTVIGVVGSSVNNEFKMRELRKMVKDLTHRESMKSSDITAASILSHHEEELSSIIKEMKAAVKGGRVTTLAHLPQESTQHIERKVEELKDLITNSQRYEGQLVAIPSDLELLIQRQTQETRLLLIGVSIVGVVLPFLITFLQK